MRKRWLMWSPFVIVCCVVLAWVFPASIYVPLGFFRHEAFFAGKPTSYWIRGLKHESFLGDAPPAGDTGKKLRDGGAAAVPVLCEIAQSPDQDLRMEALLGLSLMGAEARAAQPVLAEAIMKEKESSRFLLAAETLAKLDPAATTEVFNAILRDKQDGSRRSWALVVLLELAPECQAALPILNEMAHDPGEDVRLRVGAIRVLWRLKQPPEPLVPPLCEMIAAENTPAGVQALEAIGEMGPAAKSAVATLMKLLERPSLPVVGQPWGPPHRQAVVTSLGKIGPAARPAMPALLASLNSGNLIVRIEVALALAHMGASAKETLAVRDAIWCTNITLLAARPPANVAAAPLIQIMGRTWIPREAQTRKAIREAIQRIDPDATARTRAR